MPSICHAIEVILGFLSAKVTIRVLGSPNIVHRRIFERELRHGLPVSRKIISEHLSPFRYCVGNLPVVC
ncbi:MAG: hypothetical protein JWM55_1526 [Acidimicrobiaceae bacterium]|nr:hypothetical protein [Acidimicrobiaceae bacterium]